MFGNAIQNRGSLVARPFLFRFLDLFPLGPDGIDGAGAAFSENMRMPANEFIDDVARDFLEIERAPFPGELRMKDNLEEQIA